MIKSEYYVIGCMSGTSLDGLDLAYLKFKKKEKWTYKIIVAETISYSKLWKHKLTDLITFSKSDLNRLDNEYTALLASKINIFTQQNDITKIDAICSHGHTALHQPENGITYQIGNLKDLSVKTKRKVVCDFRKQDVEFGGQGAPLVPIGDELLFSDYDYCLNLGGFANISFKENNKRIAFDICPVNIVLNHFASKLGYEYDSNGKLASRGNINLDLLSELNNLEFYQADFPKSLGIEWVKSKIYPIIDNYNLSLNDKLRTFVEHIVTQINNALDNNSNRKVLISGGGVYNTFLIELLKENTKCEIIMPENNIIDYKEALIFGFLGVLKLRNEVNCLASVTGAVKNHSSGVIFSNSI